jgi:hypothetical protein
MSTRLPGPNAEFMAALHGPLAAEYGIDPDDRGERRYLLRDLLTDCRHYADQYGIDFFDALDGSYQVYLEEKDDASDQ